MERSQSTLSEREKGLPVSNGRLTKEQLAEKTRFRFKEQTLELPELGGSIVLKSLTVGEREALPDLTDADGKPDAGIPKIAALFAAIVADPKVTTQEAEEFLPGWPAEALDALLVAYGKLAGTEEEAAAAAAEFRNK